MSDNIVTSEQKAWMVWEHYDYGAAATYANQDGVSMEEAVDKLYEKIKGV